MSRSQIPRLKVSRFEGSAPAGPAARSCSKMASARGPVRGWVYWTVFRLPGFRVFESFSRGPRLAYMA